MARRKKPVAAAQATPAAQQMQVIAPAVKKRHGVKKRLAAKKWQAAKKRPAAKVWPAAMKKPATKKPAATKPAATGALHLLEALLQLVCIMSRFVARVFLERSARTTAPHYPTSGPSVDMPLCGSRTGQKAKLVRDPSLSPDVP